jgi:hypothetical protein
MAPISTISKKPATDIGTVSTASMAPISTMSKKPATDIGTVSTASMAPTIPDKSTTECHVCGKRLATPARLERHIQRDHVSVERARQLAHALNVKRLSSAELPQNLPSHDIRTQVSFDFIHAKPAQPQIVHAKPAQ